MSWKEDFERLGADGVDFVPIGFNPCCTPQEKIFESYTKNEMLNGNVSYPRSAHLFWIMKNGLKCYLIEKKKMPEFCVSDMLGHILADIDEYHRGMMVHFSDVDKIFEKYAKMYGDQELKKIER